jgi:hypothetical protein
MQANRRQGLPEENGCHGDPKWLEVVSNRLRFDAASLNLQEGMLFSERRYADDCTPMQHRDPIFGMIGTKALGQPGAWIESQISGRRHGVIHIAFQRMTWRDNALSICQLFLGQQTRRHR